MRPGSEIPPAAGTWAMAEECEGCCSVWYGCVYREGDGGAKVRVYGNRFAVASLKFVVVDDAYASWREWTGFQRVACLSPVTALHCHIQIRRTSSSFRF